ncbi:MAG: hypothetical protein J0M04_11545 [Verrucomicrobia bacterium]|nr:hypothetical protein [Verrucomicrobiota bacterium]
MIDVRQLKMTGKTFTAVLCAACGFALGYVTGLFSIAGRGKDDSAPRPVVQPVGTTPITGWLRDSRAVMVSYSIGERGPSGITFGLSQSDARRLGDALAADLPSCSNEGRLLFADHFDLVFLGGSGLTKLRYDVTAGAARISSEGYGPMTVRDTSFLRELLPLIHQAEHAATLPESKLEDSDKPQSEKHSR